MTTNNNLCVSCLKDENIYNIFDTHECEGIEEIYVQMLKSCFDITISESSGLQAMCETCILKLRDAFYLKQNISENIQILENHNNIKTYGQEPVQASLNPITGLLDVVVLTEADLRLGVGTKINKPLENCVKLESKSQNDIVIISNKMIKREDFKDSVKSEFEKVDNENKIPETNFSDATEKSKANAPFTIEPGQTQCSICQKTFEASKTLYEHMNVHYANHVCELCGKKFACKVRFARHQKIHLEGPFPCNFCDQVFSKLNTRNAHVWRVHSTPLPYACARCPRRFPTFHRRLAHMQAEHGHGKQYQCPHCDHSFYFAGARSKHIRSTHLQIKNHKCAHCKMSFFKPRDLRSHMATIHNIGEKRFKCTLCDKSFYKSCTLKLHVRRHEEKANASHECPICGARFKIKAVLRNHILSHKRNPPPTVTEDFNERVIVEYEEESNDTVYFEVS